MTLRGRRTLARGRLVQEPQSLRPAARCTLKTEPEAAFGQYCPPRTCRFRRYHVCTASNLAGGGCNGRPFHTCCKYMASSTWQAKATSTSARRCTFISFIDYYKPSGRCCAYII